MFNLIKQQLFKYWKYMVYWMFKLDMSKLFNKYSYMLYI